VSALLLLTLAGVFVTRTAFARFRQADADLGLARTARDTVDYEWSLSPASKRRQSNQSAISASAPGRHGAMF